jgi:hypothetical protein
LQPAVEARTDSTEYILRYINPHKKCFGVEALGVPMTVSIKFHAMAATARQHPKKEQN